jgi:hypothetical protein
MAQFICLGSFPLRGVYLSPHPFETWQHPFVLRQDPQSGDAPRIPNQVAESRPGGLNGLRRQLSFSNRELENILHHRTRLPALLFGGIPSTDAHPRERRIKETKRKLACG